MAYRSVGELKLSVAGLLTGTNLDNVTDLEGAIERAARTLVQHVDIPHASGKQNLNLYGGVYDYEPPDTIFGGNFIDLRPQGISRDESDSVRRLFVSNFDKTKLDIDNGYQVAFEVRNGVKVMRVSQDTTKKEVVLDDMQSDTDWTLAGSGSSLVEDETVYYESPASLRFTVTGSSAATLTKAITSIDISEYEDVGVAFLAIRVPSATALTSVQLKIGSSASAYNDVTSTEGFLGAFLANEWLLIAFDFSAATQTGTPDWNAIDYVQVTINHTATMVSVRVGGLFISLPSPHELLFESAAIFQDEDDNLSNNIETDNDLIILDDSAYTLFEYQTALSIAEQMKNKGKIDEYFFKLHDERTGLYSKYGVDNPDEKVRTTGSYYQIRGIRK